MDIINVSQEKIEFQDPLFKVWFAKKFIYDWNGCISNAAREGSNDGKSEEWGEKS